MYDESLWQAWAEHERERAAERIMHIANGAIAHAGEMVAAAASYLPRAGELTLPVLIQHGAEDKLIPVRAADWFADAIPGAQKVIYPKVGHIPMEEVPDQSAADVRAFLKSACPTTSSC